MADGKPLPVDLPSWDESIERQAEKLAGIISKRWGG